MNFNRDTIAAADHADRGFWLAAPLPWVATPFRLVTLLHMLRIHARDFGMLMSLMVEIEHNITGATEEFGCKPTWETIDHFLTQLVKIFDRLELDSPAAWVERMRQDFPTKQFTPEEIRAAVKQLSDRIEDQLDKRLFMFVPTHRAKYFDGQPEQTRGLSASIREDLEEAGKCIGAARYTAAVFHLMRVMERGVVHLAKKLNTNINTDRPWGTILQGVDAAIAQLPGANMKAPPVERKKHQRFAEVAAYLRNVKDGWRNEVMHPKRTYTEEEAEYVFMTVARFIRAVRTLRR